jgi:hypothetical protein
MSMPVQKMFPVTNVKETVIAMMNVPEILCAFKEETTLVLWQFLVVEMEVLKDGIIVIVVLPAFLLYVTHVLQPNI